MARSANAKTDGKGRFLTCGIDFMDMQDMRLRNESHVLSRDPIEATSPVLKQPLWRLESGIPYTRAKGKNMRFSLLAHFVSEYGVKPDEMCEYFSSKSMKVIRHGNFEYREQGKKLARIRIDSNPSHMLDTEK